MNAVISVTLSGYCLLFETDSSEDVWYNSVVARTACALIVGYMIAGKLCISSVERKKGLSASLLIYT